MFTQRRNVAPHPTRARRPAASNRGRPPIRRRRSCRLTDDRYTFEWCIKNPSAADATILRAAMMRDWIDNHHFSRPSVETMYLVDWEQILTHERVLAVHHAHRRALGALSEYKCLLKESPHPPGTVSDSLDLTHFIDETSGDTNTRHVMITELDFEEPALGSDRRVPRTIVVLAKAYHRLLVLKEEAAREAGQWILFRTWLCDPSQRKLADMSLSERILKEGAISVVKRIHSGIREYKTIRNRLKDKYGAEIRIEPINDVKDFGRPNLDLCDLTAGFIRRLDLLSNSHQDGHVLLRRARPAARVDDFYAALAFRAGTLENVLSWVRYARDGAARAGIDITDVAR